VHLQHLVLKFLLRWEIHVGEVVDGACEMVLLEAEATSPVHAANGLRVEAKLPYDLVGVASYDGTRSVHLDELRQQWLVAITIALPREIVVRRPLVNAVASERPTVQTTPQHEVLCHGLHYDLLDRSVLLSGQRSP
jgi:hypothetical protein